MSNDMIQTWKTAQEWEADWHGNCINSLNEEQKQIVYAEKMGLIRTPTPKTPYNFDLQGKSVLDIGGGAYSLLLKCVNFSDSYVADPLVKRYPEWVIKRYNSIGVMAVGVTGEKLLEKMNKSKIFDEVWMYNVLEHVIDPEKIIQNALELGRVVRIFEWLDTRTNIGHPHTLTEEQLNAWLGGEGKVEAVNRGGAVGKAYYGVFKGKHHGL